ncbi:MAG: phage integrase N-terminal SAM-like domain-containing protein [Rhizobiales bacterium]|nr:phage integrase N-terminal SAM-like domain-containing protein [Hyphomicrobiales bacterium]
MRRMGSKNQLFVQRIPADLKERLVGRTISIPVGDSFRHVTITKAAQSIRFSLGTDDPTEVKVRQASVTSHLERIWQALRQDAPITLTREQAVALSGRLYRAWADSESRFRTLAVEQGEDGKMHPVAHDPEHDEAHLKAALQRWLRADTIGQHEMDKPIEQRKPVDLDDPPSADEVPERSRLEVHLGPLVDRLLRAEGIGKVDAASRGLLLVEFWRALRDALELLLRRSQGDYSPDPKAERFPAWRSPLKEHDASATKGIMLAGIFDGWWKEAKARGLSQSTHDSYEATIKNLIAFLGHDDAGRTTEEDVIRFKDHRLAMPHPHKEGQTISARTVKDSDLAALKSVFGWAVANRKLPSNPAAGVVVKLPRQRKVRDKGFTDKEANAILKAALQVEQEDERPELLAAKRWVPWLMAYNGSRVGEMAQLRKQDLHREKGHWYITVTPEAGTVKTQQVRDVYLHPHLVEMGFVDFVESAPEGYLFMRPASLAEWRGPWRTVKNRIRELARSVVKDTNVAPNHGWRHRFKTTCRRVGIDPETRDYIQGHVPRTEGEDYGTVPIEAQALALTKFPRYAVS